MFVVSSDLDTGKSWFSCCDHAPSADLGIFLGEFDQWHGRYTKVYGQPPDDSWTIAADPGVPVALVRELYDTLTASWNLRIDEALLAFPSEQHQTRTLGLLPPVIPTCRVPFQTACSR